MAGGNWDRNRSTGAGVGASVRESVGSDASVGSDKRAGTQRPWQRGRQLGRMAGNIGCSCDHSCGLLQGTYRLHQEVRMGHRWYICAPRQSEKINTPCLATLPAHSIYPGLHCCSLTWGRGGTPLLCPSLGYAKDGTRRPSTPLPVLHDTPLTLSTAPPDPQTLLPPTESSPVSQSLSCPHEGMIIPVVPNHLDHLAFLEHLLHAGDELVADHAHMQKAFLLTVKVNAGTVAHEGLDRSRNQIPNRHSLLVGARHKHNAACYTMLHD